MEASSEKRGLWLYLVKDSELKFAVFVDIFEVPQ